MEKKLIARINALAKKARVGALTDAELKEQAQLRARYLADFRKNMETTLENVYIIEKDGTKKQLTKRKNK